MLSFKKIVSLVLVVVCLISTFAVIAPMNASAATSSTYVIPGEYRLESAAKSKAMWNLYGNQSSNCTKICTWQRDNSPEQIVVLKYEGDGAYRIYFKDHSTKCTDVLRYTSPLKSGQKIELYEDNDDIAQLVVPYKVNEHTVIFLMKANPSLAISVNKTSNGSQLVLKPFNASDKKQQWVFRSTDSSFKKVSAFTTNEPGSAPTVTMPTSMYSLTGIVFTIDGESFRQAKLEKDLGTSASTSAGTLFWLDKNNYVVSAPGTLNKLQDLVMINELRPNFISILEGWQSAATGYYDVLTAWTQIGSFGNVMGTSLGVAVGVAATGGIKLADVGIEVLGTVADPENVSASAFLAMTRLYSSNVINCGTEGLRALENTITSYDKAEYAMNMYALVAANQAALEHLAGEQVRDIANSNWFDFPAHYLKEAVMGFAGAVIPDIPVAQMAWYITNGSASLLDFGMSTGVLEVYEDAFGESGRYLGNTYPKLHQAAEDLIDAVMNQNPYIAYGLQDKVSELMDIYEPGSRKNYFSQARCYQCHGFACEALMLFWNTGKPTPTNSLYTYYKATASKSYVDKIRPGDMVRYRSGNYDHTIVITNVDDEYIYYADCNADLKGTIEYNKRMSKNELASLLTKKLIDQAVSTRGYICHYRYNNL